jgi:DNA-binding response OmpR family regulator
VKSFDPGELLARLRVHFELLPETSRRINRQVRDIADEVVLTGELPT